jgi:primosomal protein N' (replication factor Y)
MPAPNRAGEREATSGAGVATVSLGPATGGVAGLDRQAVIVEVAVAAPIPGGEALYDYIAPPALAGQVEPGVRVLVPLAGRLVEGFCLRVKSGSELSPERLKLVAAVLDPHPLYPAVILDLAVWTARRYLCQPGEVLRAAGPARKKPDAGARARLVADESTAREIAVGLSARASIQSAILMELALGHAETAVMRRKFGPRTPQALESLVAKGLVILEPPQARLERRARKKNVAAGVQSEGGDGRLPSPSVAPVQGLLNLSAAQETALAAITSALRSGIAGDAVGREAALSGGATESPPVFVLHGVTGSGKTEVYLRAAAETLAQGRQVLLLVPEVALVPQTLTRVRSHLGAARVAVAHSYLGGRDRLDAWKSIATGSADVVVGARSAVFAPLARLGLIVLDEEHEEAYKQEEGAPRYHAREVAVRRARREGATLLLASATPSLESYCRAVDGQYHLVSLPERIGGRSLPPVQVVDMRDELASGNRGLFSRTLQASLAEALSRGRQVILFLNRRGHSTFVLCRECGWVARCPQCDVSLTYHNSRADLLCHYCGSRAAAPVVCPGCGGHRVRYFGAGTQRIEDEVRTFYPEARAVRLDSDVISHAGEVHRVLAQFESGQAQILIGTQMVAKGLDVAGVGLVAAVAADSALHLPDFRAPERTFRLLTQAAGRAGRGDDPGKVVVQTYNPQHPAITAAARHDYLSFAHAELKTRRSLGYPPYSHLVRIEVSHADETLTRQAAEALADGFKSLGLRGGFPPGGPAERPRFAGPAPAPLARLRGRFRWHILVFCPELEEGLTVVKEAVRQVTGRQARGGRRQASSRPVTLVDVDPTSVL